MAGRIIIFIVLFLVWLYILTVFKRKKLEFFYFLLGSIGTFLFSFALLRNVMTKILTTLTCFLTGLLGNVLGLFKAYTSHSILFIENADGPISLYVDFECGGVIEILVFISLIWFFAVYKVKEKALISLAGIVWIILANIIRLFSICLIINKFGNESYYVAHTIVGRLIFYALSIILYFYVFTRAQIRKQRVGEFGYDNEDSK
ncbi:MAG: exosortase family protein XrtG [Roseburia sp.]|nr:exosortase family protein XrtG [Ruminococcus sp.]MCM1155196.1 exosortase family protein XrtG [Roseburia sp.]MCM1243281.1 exosortase family protein XrtG [Roseburia sp.]